MERNEMIAQIVARVVEKLALAGETVTGTAEALSPVPDSSLPGLLILTQDHGCDCHTLLESSRIKEKYNTCCALLQENQVDMEAIDAVVLFNLTTDAMCKIASGITDTPYTKLAAQALLLGKKLYVPREEVELYRYPVGGLGSFQCMLQAKLTKLVSWGLKICPLAQMEDCILGEAPAGMTEEAACQPAGSDDGQTESCQPVGPENGQTESCQSAAGGEAALEECAAAPAEEKEITFSKKVITERDIIEANRDNVKVIRITERNILTALAKDAASARNIRLIRE